MLAVAVRILIVHVVDNKQYRKNFNNVHSKVNKTSSYESFDFQSQNKKQIKSTNTITNNNNKLKSTLDNRNDVTSIDNQVNNKFEVSRQLPTLNSVNRLSQVQQQVNDVIPAKNQIQEPAPVQYLTDAELDAHFANTMEPFIQQNAPTSLHNTYTDDEIAYSP
jgi:hypothetical protein